MKKLKDVNLKDFAILTAVAFAWSKLGLGASVDQFWQATREEVIPNGTTVQYIPLGKQNWGDAKTGKVTGTLYEGEVLTHYQITGTLPVLIAFVRKA